MDRLFTVVEGMIKDKNKHIVFPESTDKRILEAASKLGASGLLTPVLIGERFHIRQTAEETGVDVSSCQIVDPADFEEFDLMVETFVDRRNGKVMAEEAHDILQDANYFGTMLVYMNQADGLVSGAVHSTAETVRPALQIIKTKEGIQKTSGMFIMVRDEEKYVFADCAINMNPDEQDLAEIAVESANTAKLFDIDPRVAMLSFSTKGSAQSDETEKVAAAVDQAKKKDPTLMVDGEFQFDAAFVPSIAQTKAPDSELGGEANVFIFPSLESGNIGYKIAQRLGEFEAVGPVLQGLNQSVNDLSRGCSAEDVYHLALITAAQSEA